MMGQGHRHLPRLRWLPSGMLSMFVGDQAFTFTRHPMLAGLNAQSFKDLRKAVGNADDPAFPAQYKAYFLGPDDKRIEGSFSAATDAARNFLRSLCVRSRKGRSPCAPACSH